jgi:hypothetical protein
LLTFTKDVVSADTTKGKEHLSTTAPAAWIASTANQFLQPPVTRCPSS